MKNNKMPALILLSGISVFFVDVYFQNIIISIFYILPVLISALSKQSITTVWAFIVSTLMSTMAVFYIYGMDISWLNVSYKIFCTTVIGLFTIVLVKYRDLQEELNKLNLNMELKVLARTSAAANQIAILEKQISILEALKDKNSTNTVVYLDNVIKQLKVLRDDTIEEKESLYG